MNFPRFRFAAALLPALLAGPAAALPNDARMPGGIAVIPLPEYLPDPVTIRFNGMQTPVLTRPGGEPLLLAAEKRNYQVRGMPMTEAGIDPGLTRDIYISLGEPLDKQAWSVRLSVKPFVRWLWLGEIFMAAGGVIAMCDGRFRRVAARQVAGGTHTEAARS